MKSYSIIRLHELKFQTEVLRACPQITMDTANLINMNHLNFKKAIAQYGEEADLLNERTDSETYLEDVKTLNSKKFDVDVQLLHTHQFKTIEGDKEVALQDGTSRKFSYREAYFSLLGEVIE